MTQHDFRTAGQTNPPSGYPLAGNSGEKNPRQEIAPHDSLFAFIVARNGISGKIDRL